MVMDTIQITNTRKWPKQKWWDPIIGIQSNFFNISPSNFKEWLWSAKALTTMVWILLPLGYVTILLLLVIPQSQKVESSLLSVLIFDLPTEVTEVVGMGVIDVIIIPPIPLMLILFLFSVYPAVYPTKKFFKKRGSVNVVIEYQYIRKILFAFLISSIVTIVMIYFLIPIMNEQVIPLYSQGLSNTEIYRQVHLIPLIESLYFMVSVLLAVPIFILLKLLLGHTRRQFSFHYAEACFEIIYVKKSETDKAGYLSLGLDWYNKFFKRITKSGIDVDTIYSRIISHSQLSNNILLDTIMDSFQNGDEFKPMRHMLALLSCWKEGGTLVKLSLRTKIRESSDLLIPIVTVVITIITTFFLPK
jgi:hypothetical protein